MKNSKILKKSLKQLVNRFGREDFVSAILNNPVKENIKVIKSGELIDNHYLKKAQIDEGKIIQEQKNIRQSKILEHIIVRNYKDKYEVVVGREKLLAAKKEKIEELEVIILPLSDEETLLFILKDISNRKVVNVYELALVCYHLKNDFNYKNKELADFLNQSPSQISNLLKILSLPSDVLINLSINKISYGHAKAICRINENDIRFIVKEIEEKRLSVRETERLVRTLKNKGEIVEQVDNAFVEEKRELENTNNSFQIVLTFKDEKSFLKGQKRINKLIKRKKLVLK